jgi:hypothetical protein
VNKIVDRIVSFLIAVLFSFSITGVAFAQSNPPADKPAAMEEKKAEPGTTKKASTKKPKKKAKKGKKAAKKTKKTKKTNAASEKPAEQMK